MIPLFPEITPYESGMLPVSSLHSLYYEQAGNPQGAPILYLHGGPGGGLSPLSARFYDPEFYRIVLFDQRGSGKSTPHAELRDNTTWALVEDIEKLRQKLGIERWLVFGGSWGSTLALTYAICHPDRVKGLILRGIFMARQSELNWLYQDGASHVYPDGWEAFSGFIPTDERDDLVTAYYRRLTGEDEQMRLKAAAAWSRWEEYASRLLVNLEDIDKEVDPVTLLPVARIETHYFVNKGFFEHENWLLEGARRINHIPTRIIQGRYDMVCPATTAWELKKAMPDADLRIVPDGGHSVRDEGIGSGLIAATEDFKTLA
ncbi:MAG TPA: prolyl aminopeptidase [Anaerolineaceae bacterium]|nr:prolyl aminopeptidase [Anaerolineaceae bacterium]HPN51448.1 prolyl aminopeptidase [Anaerolineaceae bacterium]